MNFNTEVNEMLCMLRGNFREPRRARRISSWVRPVAELSCLVATALQEAMERVFTLASNTATSTEELFVRTYPFGMPRGATNLPRPALGCHKEIKMVVPQFELAAAASHIWPWKDNSQWIFHSTDTSENPYRINLMANQVKELFGEIPDDIHDFILAS